MLLIHRPESGGIWPARFLSAVVFIACAGAQDRATGRKLDDAFRRGGLGQVRSLRFRGAPGQSDWLRGDGWALTTDAAE
jgi:protein-L-isoaspartate(D-aspartate) O-methyltransferase